MIYWNVPIRCAYVDRLTVVNTEKIISFVIKL